MFVFSVIWFLCYLCGQFVYCLTMFLPLVSAPQAAGHAHLYLLIVKPVIAAATISSSSVLNALQFPFTPQWSVMCVLILSGFLCLLVTLLLLIVSFVATSVCLCEINLSCFQPTPVDLPSSVQTSVHVTEKGLSCRMFFLNELISEEGH